MAEAILNNIEKGNNIIQTYPVHNNIVLVLGNTGAGKSTFLQYIAGNNSNLISECDDSTDECTITDINKKIGQSILYSYTEIPELIFDDDTQTAFYDCPGFSDNRDAAHDISGSYFINTVIKSSKAIKFIFIMNYDAFKAGAKNPEFMTVATHATNMIKEIDKFKGGIALIATKVDSQKSDRKIINVITRFLVEARNELKKKTPSPTDQNIIKFIGALLKVNSNNQTELIGFVRQPTESGAFINLPEMQSHKVSLKNIITNMVYIEHNATNDFSYTISPDSQIYLNDLETVIQNNITNTVGSNVATIVLDHYKSLVVSANDTISFFLINKTVTITNNIPDIISVSDKLIKGYNIISQLVEEKTDTTPEELSLALNNSINNELNINISKDAQNILNQGKYLTFLYTTQALETNLSSLTWKPSLQDLVQNIRNLQISILDYAKTKSNEIKSWIKSDVDAAGEKIMNYFTNKEATVRDIENLSTEIKSGYDTLLATKTISNKSTGPKGCITLIKNDVAKVIDQNRQILIDTIKYGEYLKFLQTDQSITFNCAEGLNNLIDYLNNAQKWYKFLIHLYDKLSGHEVQIDISKYSNFIQVISSKDVNKPVSDTALLSLLQMVYPQRYSSEYYDIIKDIPLDSYKLNILKAILNITLKDSLNISCDEDRLVVKGRYVKLSSIGNRTCSKPIKTIEIFALNTVFIDIDSDYTGRKVNFAIISPKWDIQGTRNIIIDGGLGPSNNPLKANNGQYVGMKGSDGKPGLPGGPAGHFLGIGANFINSQGLTISANGGKGGTGQQGGDGAKGKDGNLPKFGSPEEMKDEWNKNGFNVLWEEDVDVPNLEVSSVRGYGSWKIYGTNCSNGSPGGLGGIGGFGGTRGNVTFIPLSAKIIPYISTNIGERGTQGAEGSGGKPGRSGELLHITDSHSAALMIRYGYRYKLESQTPFRSCESGLSGIPGNNTNQIVYPQKEVEWLNRANTVNNYKIFLRDHLSNSTITDLDLRTFLDQLEAPPCLFNNNSAKSNSALSVCDLYNISGFLNELNGLEEQFYQIHKKISFTNFYQSLLNRLDQYIGNVQGTDEYQKNQQVLNYLRVATISKIHNINNHVEDYLVIDVNEYINVVTKHIDQYKNALLEVKINTHKERYQDSISKQITEANNLVEKDILPEIDNIIKETDENINLLVNETISLQDVAKTERANLIRTKEKLEEQLVIKTILGVIQVGSQALAMAGPIGSVAGASIGIISSVVQNTVLDDTSEGDSTITPLPDSISKAITTVESLLEHKKTIFEEKLNSAEKAIETFLKEEPSNSDITEIKEKLVAAKNELKKEKDKDDSSDPASIDRINNLNKDITELTQNKINLLKEQKPGDNMNIEKCLRIANHVQNIVTIGNAAYDVYSQMENDKAKIKDTDLQIEKSNDKITKLEQYEKSIYNIIIPMIHSLNDPDMRNQLKGKSHMALDVKKWKIQSGLKDVQLQIREMTEGFKVQPKVMRCIEKFEYGILTMIQMYDRIQDVYDKEQLANYIADLNSVKIENQTFSTEVNKLETMIQSNLVLQEHGKAVKAFQQYIFPFADMYLGRFNLPDNITRSNNISDLVHTAVTQIAFLGDEITKDATILRKTPYHIFPNVRFDSSKIEQAPFFVWKHDKYADEIVKLLRGEEIIINADISLGIKQNAIKFSEIGIKFILSNSTIEDQENFDKQLSYFLVDMTHLGNSYYKCDNKYYIITHDTISIKHSVGKEQSGGRLSYYHLDDTTTKIMNNKPIFSPYTLWQIQLLSKDGVIDNFNVLKNYTTQVIDVVLEGRGQYIEQTISVCNDNLKQYYKVDDNPFHKRRENNYRVVREIGDTKNNKEDYNNLFVAGSTGNTLKPAGYDLVNWLKSKISPIKYLNPVEQIKNWFNQHISSAGKKTLSKIDNEYQNRRTVDIINGMIINDRLGRTFFSKGRHKPISDGSKVNPIFINYEINFNATIILAEMVARIVTGVRDHNSCISYNNIEINDNFDQEYAHKLMFRGYNLVGDQIENIGLLTPNN